MAGSVITRPDVLQAQSTKANSSRYKDVFRQTQGRNISSTGLQPAAPNALTSSSSFLKDVALQGSRGADHGTGLFLSDDLVRTRALSTTLLELRDALRTSSSAEEATYRKRAKFELQDRTVTRDVTDTRDVFETRNVFETRDILESRDVMGTRDIFETRDVFGTRDVFETRDITETRAVYETRDVMENRVRGTKKLDSLLYNGWDDVGITEDAEFQVRVGSGAAATIKFERNDLITVTVGGRVTDFSFLDANGAWRGALVGALNEVEGLTARIASNGRLDFQTDAGASLTLTDTLYGPLSRLGLTAGTHTGVVIGTEQVQVGTEQVVVGTEQVKIGTEQVVVGTEQVKIGTEDVVVGTEQVKIGTEDVAVGTEQVNVGTIHFVTGQESVVAKQRVLAGYDDAFAGYRRVNRGPDKTRIESLLAEIRETVGSSRSAGNLLAGGRVDLGRQRAGIEGEDFSPEALRLGDLDDLSSKRAVDLALRRVDRAIGKAAAFEARLQALTETIQIAPTPGGVRSAEEEVVEPKERAPADGDQPVKSEFLAAERALDRSRSLAVSLRQADHNQRSLAGLFAILA